MNAKQGKYQEFAAGWIKTSKSGTEFISAVADNKRTKTKVYLETEDGAKIELSNFVVFFNENKKNENSPDVRFVVSSAAE